MTTQVHPAPEPGGTSRLVAGIPLLFEHPSMRTRDRLALSSGVVNAGGSRSHKLSYRETAYVPREPWRAPTDEELALLSPEGAPARPKGTGFIAVIKVPEAPIRALHDLGIRDAPSPEACLELAAKDHFAATLNELLSELWPYCATAEGLWAIGIGIAHPGLVTSSVSPDRRNREGLHVDALGNADDERKGARNRMVINLGTEPRYLLYVNRLVSELSPGVLPYRNHHGTQVWNDILAADPGYPVVRLRLDPFEAYMAPTYDMIHDGSSKDKQHPDVTYSLCGSFQTAPA
jgi:hypothetical protein